MGGVGAGVIVLRRRNESTAAIALSPRWASITHRARWIQREGRVWTRCADGVVPICDAAQRARLHPECHVNRWDLHMFSQCGYMMNMRGNNQAWLNLPASAMLVFVMQNVTDSPLTQYIVLKHDHRPSEYG